jgi:hypothetical protein
MVIDPLGIIIPTLSGTLGTVPTPATMTMMMNPIEAIIIITTCLTDHHILHAGSHPTMGMTPNVNHLMDQVATEGEATVEEVVVVGAGEEGEDHQAGEGVKLRKMLTMDGTVVSQCPWLHPPEMAHQVCMKQQSTIEG